MENCFICGKTLSEGEVMTVQKKRIQTLIKASVIRGDKEHECMLTPLTSLRVHIACQIHYGDERIAAAAVRRGMPSQTLSSSRTSTPSRKTEAQLRTCATKHTRESPTPWSVSENKEFDLKTCCFICTETFPENVDEINKNLRHNKRIRISTVRSFSATKKSILSKLMNRTDELSLSIIARIKGISDAADAGARYHNKCHLKILNSPKRGLKRGRACEGIDDVIVAIYDYMKNNNDDRPFKLSDIIGKIDGAEVADIRTIKKYLLNKYPDSITMSVEPRLGTIIRLKNACDKGSVC